MTVVMMDVTDIDSIQSCVKVVESEYPGGIFAVINNAGWALFLEEPKCV